jgi:macrolide-specific efflux system membrane fusion protein
MPRQKKMFAWGAAALFAVAAAIAGPKLFRGNKAENVATATVTLGDIEKTANAVGSLKPKEYVDVGTQVSGQLQKVYVEVGERIKKGALIAEIDPSRYESTVQSDRATVENLQAQLNQQQAEFELAQQQFDRNQKMQQQEAVSQDTVDQLQAALKVAAAKIASTQAQLRGAQATLKGDVANLSYTRIYSPIDGTVASQTTLQGQTVNSSQSAPTIVQVANLDVMTVWAEVAEADVNKIKLGTPVYFTTLGNADRKWTGTVRQIQPTPVTTNDVVLYNVLVDTANPDGVLLPDMTVQVFFVLGEAKHVPIAPVAGLEAAKGGARNSWTATVLTDAGQEKREVKVGLTTRTQAEVLSGLAVGDRLLVADAAPAPAAKTAQNSRVPGMGGPRL